MARPTYEQLACLIEELECEPAKCRQAEEDLARESEVNSSMVELCGDAHDFNNLLTALEGYFEFAAIRLESGHPASRSPPDRPQGHRLCIPGR